MALDGSMREILDRFRQFVEESLASDDRYGSAERIDTKDGSTVATRFRAGPSCWLELAVLPGANQLRVGFVTRDPEQHAALEEAFGSDEQSVESMVESGFRDAGMDWEQVPVEHEVDPTGLFRFATPLALDEISDLEMAEIRDMALRMLEGYLIAFGPALTIDEEEQ